jgi:hypothetical protein
MAKVFSALYSVYKTSDNGQPDIPQRDFCGRLFIDRDEVTLIEEYADDEGMIDDGKCTIYIKAGRRIVLDHSFEEVMEWKRGIIP